MMHSSETWSTIGMDMYTLQKEAILFQEMISCW